MSWIKRLDPRNLKKLLPGHNSGQQQQQLPVTFFDAEPFVQVVLPPPPGKTFTIPIMVAFTSGVGEATKKRGGVDMQLLLDRSGSMQEQVMVGGREVGKKSRFLIDAVTELITMMRDTDRIGIGAFDSTFSSLKEMTYCTDTGKRQLVQGMVEFKGLGATNIQVALSEGADLLERTALKGRPKVLVLVSDGDHSSGYGSPFPVVERFPARKINFNTVGIGSDITAEGQIMLQKLSGARYLHINDTTKISQVLQGIATLHQNTFLSNVRIAFQPAGQTVRKLNEIAIVTKAENFYFIGGTQADWMVSIDSVQSQESYEAYLELSCTLDSPVPEATLGEVLLIADIPSLEEDDVIVGRKEIKIDFSEDAKGTARNMRVPVLKQMAKIGRNKIALSTTNSKSEQERLMNETTQLVEATQFAAPNDATVLGVVEEFNELDLAGKDAAQVAGVFRAKSCLIDIDVTQLGNIDADKI